MSTSSSTMRTVGLVSTGIAAPYPSARPCAPMGPRYGTDARTSVSGSGNEEDAMSPDRKHARHAAADRARKAARRRTMSWAVPVVVAVAPVVALVVMATGGPDDRSDEGAVGEGCGSRCKWRGA